MYIYYNCIIVIVLEVMQMARKSKEDESGIPKNQIGRIVTKWTNRNPKS